MASIPALCLTGVLEGILWLKTGEAAAQHLRSDLKNFEMVIRGSEEMPLPKLQKVNHAKAVDLPHG